MASVTGQFNNLYTRKIDEVFFEGWDEKPEQWSKYLHPKTSDQNNETYQSFAGGTPWSTKPEMENANEQTFNLANLIQTNHTPFGVVVTMSREQIDDSKYDEVMDMVKDQGRQGRAKVEQNCVSVLDNAFDGTNYPIYDGQALISAGHTYGKTGMAGTQSNLATGGLTDTNIKAGLNLFNSIKGESGTLIDMDADRLVTHKDNQWTVATILESALRASSGNNDKNVLPNLQVVLLSYISSKIAWFLESEQHNLVHFFRVEPQFVKRQYKNPNGSQSWDGYFRDSTERRNWRGIVGSAG